MGFGLLFIGYLLLVPISLGFFYTVPVSAVFLAVAGWKLARVNRPFGKSFFCAILLGVAGGVATLFRLPALKDRASYPEAIALAVILVWHILVLTGLEWVSTETGLTALRQRALRNKIYACLYYIPAILLTALDGVLLPDFAVEILRGASLAVIALGLVVFFLNGLLIWRAYANICMPEDLDMPRKPSRFSFVNEARARADEKEAAAREASRKKQEEYRRRRKKEWDEKQKAKGNRKKQ